MCQITPPKLMPILLMISMIIGMMMIIAITDAVVVIEETEEQEDMDKTLGKRYYFFWLKIVAEWQCDKIIQNIGTYSPEAMHQICEHWKNNAIAVDAYLQNFALKKEALSSTEKDGVKPLEQPPLFRVDQHQGGVLQMCSAMEVIMAIYRGLFMPGKQQRAFELLTLIKLDNARSPSMVEEEQKKQKPEGGGVGYADWVKDLNQLIQDVKKQLYKDKLRFYANLFFDMYETIILHIELWQIVEELGFDMDAMCAAGNEYSQIYSSVLDDALEQARQLIDRLISNSTSSLTGSIPIEFESDVGKLLWLIRLQKHLQKEGTSSIFSCQHNLTPCTVENLNQLISGDQMDPCEEAKLKVIKEIKQAKRSRQNMINAEMKPKRAKGEAEQRK